MYIYIYTVEGAGRLPLLRRAVSTPHSADAIGELKVKEAFVPN